MVRALTAVYGLVLHRAGRKPRRERLSCPLQLLRCFWQEHRNPVLLFPNRAAGLKGVASATTPLDHGGVQTTLHKVVEACGLKKRSRLTAFDTAMQPT